MLLNLVPKFDFVWIVSCCWSNHTALLLKFVAEKKCYYFWWSPWLIIMDSCILSFHLNCIMQLKQFYNIATKVSSRKKCYYFWWSTWLIRLMPSHAVPRNAITKKIVTFYCARHAAGGQTIKDWRRHDLLTMWPADAGGLPKLTGNVAV